VTLRTALAISVLGALFAGACSADAVPGGGDRTAEATTTSVTVTSPWPSDPGDGPHRWTVRVVRDVDHDPAAFTQGLEQTPAGILEGTGRRGRSTLRLVDLDTGTVLESRPLADEYFGEGLTVVDDEVIQLTWTSGIALRYDAATLEPVGSYTYAGEGWGLCFDGVDLWMSDGSARLARRNPETFAVLDDIEVRRAGDPVENLNELECIDGRVVANIWKSGEIVVIDPATGTVEATIDASGLVDAIDAADRDAVLNGIADLGDGTVLLGGKLWPRSFVVELVVADDD
jgi:glutaminyl-peptide cyclotransferase